MLERAIELLQETMGVDSQPGDWGYESVTMEKEELDIDRSPQEIDFPNIVLTHLYILSTDILKKEYVVYFITDMKSELEYIQGILVDGEALDKDSLG